MSYYYNGEPLEFPPGKCVADVLKEKGVTWEQYNRIVDRACSFKCCDEFERAFDGNTGLDIDLGTGEQLGRSVRIPIETDDYLRVTQHGWTDFKFCPYCGRSFKVRLEDKE